MSRVQGDVLKICTLELYFSARSFMPRKPIVKSNNVHPKISKIAPARSHNCQIIRSMSFKFFQHFLAMAFPPAHQIPEAPAKVWSKSPGPRTGCWLMGLMHPKVIPKSFELKGIETSNWQLILRCCRYLSVIGIYWQSQEAKIDEHISHPAQLTVM